MPAELVVRAAEESEFAAIGELGLTAYSTAGHLDPADDYARTLLDASARARVAELLVAVREGAIVGTVTICPHGSPFAELCEEGESEFRFLAVAPEAWRSGVGEALVGACEQRARERGCRAHVICVIDSNAGAQRFYDRLGFERLPERDWQPRAGIRLLALRRAVPNG